MPQINESIDIEQNSDIAYIDTALERICNDLLAAFLSDKNTGKNDVDFFSFLLGLLTCGISCKSIDDLENYFAKLQKNLVETFSFKNYEPDQDKINLLRNIISFYESVMRQRFLLVQLVQKDFHIKQSQLIINQQLSQIKETNVDEKLQILEFCLQVYADYLNQKGLGLQNGKPIPIPIPIKEPSYKRFFLNTKQQLDKLPSTATLNAITDNLSKRDKNDFSARNKELHENKELVKQIRCDLHKLFFYNEEMLVNSYILINSQHANEIFNFDYQYKIVNSFQSLINSFEETVERAYLCNKSEDLYKLAQEISARGKDFFIKKGLFTNNAIKYGEQLILACRKQMSRFPFTESKWKTVTKSIENLVDKISQISAKISEPYVENTKIDEISGQYNDNRSKLEKLKQINEGAILRIKNARELYQTCEERLLNAEQILSSDLSNQSDDVVTLIKRHWRKLLVSALVGLAIGVGFSFIVGFSGISLGILPTAGMLMGGSFALGYGISKEICYSRESIKNSDKTAVLSMDSVSLNNKLKPREVLSKDKNEQVKNTPRSSCSHFGNTLLNYCGLLFGSAKKYQTMMINRVEESKISMRQNRC